MVNLPFHSTLIYVALIICEKGNQRQFFPCIQQKVNVTKGSTNVDLPEGTLDALMQVISCPSKVGWRNTRMKIVVVFTDAGFHIAGDGRVSLTPYHFLVFNSEVEAPLLRPSLWGGVSRGNETSETINRNIIKRLIDIAMHCRFH